MTVCRDVGELDRRNDDRYDRMIDWINGQIRAAAIVIAICCLVNTLAIMSLIMNISP